MQDPLKQGLKLSLDSMFEFSRKIRMQDPLKQGLKRREIGNRSKYWIRFECKIH